MSRVSIFLVLTLLVNPALADEPSPLSKEIVIESFGDEILLGPVAYGDTAQFWELHALVLGTVEEARLEYDVEKLIVREHLSIRVGESIPERNAPERRLLTKVFNTRFVIAFDRPAEPPPPRYHVGDELMLMDSPGQGEFRSYAMMPGGLEVCVVKELQPTVVAQTKRLCQALSTADLSKRLAIMDSLLTEKPSKPVKLVVQRSLETTTEELEVRLREAKQLLQKAGEAVPRRLPVYVPVNPEDHLSGIVETTKGRVVVMKNGEFFSVNQDTKYYRETGLDLAEATAEILQPGTAIVAAGKKDKDGELVAARVYSRLVNVLPDPPASGPDRWEWGTSAVVEGVEDDRILLDQHRYIPLDKQTKFYVNTRGEVVPAERAAVTKGAKIEFNLSGRPAVLQGKEAGTVTVLRVTVLKPVE